MSDQTAGEEALAGAGGVGASSPERDGTKASCRCLPTLQQNALRKIFERPDFTPEEVAALGYRRLQRAEGIGRKGIVTIVEWLREFGLELQSDPRSQPSRDPDALSKDLKKVEKAMRILRTHGYAVLRVGQPEDGGEDYCL